MKVIIIRWKCCLPVCIVLIYLLTGMLIFGLDIYKKVAPHPSQRIEQTLSRPKMKTTGNPEIRRVLPQPTSWKQSSLVNPAIRPRFLFNGGRKDVMFVFGVPTVLRPKRNYILTTIEYLIERMTPEQRDICLIVIYVGETSLQFGKFIVKALRVNQAEHLKSGLIDVIAPHLHYYPNFSRLHSTLNDDLERVRWRTKQNLDYIYLMSYAQPKGAYYLQLEDDVMANEGFVGYMQKSALMHGIFRFDQQPDWIVMSFSDLGFIGKLFPSSVLQSFVTYLQLFCDDQPIDWLLQSFVTLQSCRWDSISHPDCQREFESRIIRVGQAQFQHMGKISSLADKTQDEKDRWFNRNVGRQRLPHLRQPFNLVSSHRNSLLQQNLDLQPGETFIWIYMPQVPKMLKDLVSNQYQRTQLRIRNNKNTAENLPEFDVEVVNMLPDLAKNGTANKLCGFLMSHTILSEEDEDFTNNHMFYYIKEHSEDTMIWFRRFFWSPAARVRPGLDWIMIFSWTLFYWQ